MVPFVFVLRLHQHKKEGGTYSPREAEIIETKCKLDQLIAVADMELKQEKLNRYMSVCFHLKSGLLLTLLACFGSVYLLQTRL